MKFQWNPLLDTGHEKIDKQHKKLFSILNNLVEVSEQGKGEDNILNVLVFLTSYTLMHFQTEENLMIKYGYKEYSAHKHYHEDFKLTVAKLSNQLAEEGPSKDLLEIVIKTISDWLINHIKGEDLKIAVFIKNKNNDQ